MWLPSTSASHMMTTLWYLNFSMFNALLSSSVPMVTPKAVKILRISSFSNTLWCIAFSTFKILPRNGMMAWKLRSRPCFAVPPAESPSTKKISHLAGSCSEQSDNLPGNPPPPKTVLRCTISRAFLAA